MNQTKKLTQGAMLLAIIGAIMVIDRQLSFFFAEIIVLLFPVMIVIYAAMYELKDGFILSVCLAILSFLIGNISTLIYIPIVIVVGMGYAYFLKKDYSKRVLLLTSMGLFIVGELVVNFIVWPMLGIPIVDQLNEIMETFKGAIDANVLALLGGSINQILMISFIFSVILMGVIEGALIHMLSIMLLARFRIKNVKVTSLFDIKIHPALAYACFFALFLLMFSSYFAENELFLTISTILSLIGAMILLYFGYIFLLLYGRIVLKRNIVIYIIIFLVLLMPFSFIVLIIIGFLYGSGPLRGYLERKITNEKV